MAKLNREAKLRQRREDKAARKVARKLAAEEPAGRSQDDSAADPQGTDA